MKKITTVKDLRDLIKDLPDDTKVSGETGTENYVYAYGDKKHKWIKINVPEPRGPANGW